MNPTEVDMLVKPLTIKELRIQTRARGLSPGGGIEQLRERLAEHMNSSKDFSLKNEDGSDVTVVNVTAGSSTACQVEGSLKNNYVRGQGQNVGNFMTDRNSSRVLAPPGGATQISFGDYKQPSSAPAPAAASVPKPIEALPAGAPAEKPVNGEAISGGNQYGNNYSRPTGQNVGNFMTDRNSSRVLAPPGGQSQITFG
eukprot:gene11245-18870_t